MIKVGICLECSEQNHLSKKMAEDAKRVGEAIFNKYATNCVWFGYSDYDGDIMLREKHLQIHMNRLRDANAGRT